MTASLHNALGGGTLTVLQATAPVTEPFVLNACEGRDPRRERIERYISSVFQAAWDARVLSFLPLLCSLEQKGTLLAALGLRSGNHGALFCEQYLDVPVTAAVDTLHGGASCRGDILELGNLAASAPGQGAVLYLLVTAAIHEAGIRYLVFAANRAVRLSIRRSGFTPQAVAPARPERLGSAAQDWGRYYEGDPQVMIGDMLLTHQQACARPAMAVELERHAAMISALATTIRNHAG